eukprot:CAMPEP_0113567176 /NCGR_PEP_ID=MMETSP0015_2-20120614/23127_1 /TAXON_ID=2838 /ORGANISM="Odontella" /LENGTH=273 /DNA_ID=CAMNT_0000469535 /DNA_START=213 /DNA_END=1031 /DNA_ORIENTATION=- /assembly_acc=CAM_ASM_000160
MGGASANEAAEEVLANSGNAMDEFMHKVRNDPEFLKNMYTDCHNMQRVLEKNPDLKTIFQDPERMRKSFEDVYRNAGGKPPDGESWSDDDDSDDDSHADSEVKSDSDSDDDSVGKGKSKKKKKKKKKKKEEEEEQGKSVMQSFMEAYGKYLQPIMMAKKYVGMIMAFVSPAKLIGKVMTLWMSWNDDEFGVSPERKALEAAAEYFEDPDVMMEMERMLEEGGQSLEEVIEENEHLKAMRDGNPIIGGMMEDPEVFRIIVDPENLRACADLTEA